MKKLLWSRALLTMNALHLIVFMSFLENCFSQTATFCFFARCTFTPQSKWFSFFQVITVDAKTMQWQLSNREQYQNKFETNFKIRRSNWPLFGLTRLQENVLKKKWLKIKRMTDRSSIKRQISSLFFHRNDIATQKWTKYDRGTWTSERDQQFF